MMVQCSAVKTPIHVVQSSAIKPSRFAIRDSRFTLAVALYSALAGLMIGYAWHWYHAAHAVCGL
jgi:hypothetical protein